MFITISSLDIQSVVCWFCTTFQETVKTDLVCNCFSCSYIVGDFNISLHDKDDEDITCILQKYLSVNGSQTYDILLFLSEKF